MFSNNVMVQDYLHCALSIICQDIVQWNGFIRLSAESMTDSHGPSLDIAIDWLITDKTGVHQALCHRVDTKTLTDQQTELTRQ